MQILGFKGEFSIIMRSIYYMVSNIQNIDLISYLLWCLHASLIQYSIHSPVNMLEIIEGLIPHHIPHFTRILFCIPQLLLRIFQWFPTCWGKHTYSPSVFFFCLKISPYLCLQPSKAFVIFISLRHFKHSTTFCLILKVSSSFGQDHKSATVKCVAKCCIISTRMFIVNMVFSMSADVNPPHVIHAYSKYAD